MSLTATRHRLSTKLTSRLPSSLVVRCLKVVCRVRGHQYDQHFATIFNQATSDEHPWCARCGGEKPTTPGTLEHAHRLVREWSLLTALTSNGPWRVEQVGEHRQDVRRTDNSGNDVLVAHVTGNGLDAHFISQAPKAVGALSDFARAVLDGEDPEAAARKYLVEHL